MNTTISWTKEEIKSFRELLGGNQKMFADLIGIGRQQSVSVWETGKSNPSNMSKILLTQLWEKFHRGEIKPNGGNI